MSAARRLIVLTSTFPRWPGDTVPPFVYELSRRMTDSYQVTVIAPHAQGSNTKESFGGLEVIRFRYAPSAWEVLAYGGGILSNLKTQPWRYCLVPFFLLAELLALLRQLRKHPDAIVHAHWVIPQGLIAVIAMLVSGGSANRILCTLHGGDAHALGSGWMRRLRLWVLGKVGKITVVSEAMGRSVANDIDVEQMHVMPMGVDAADRFRLLPDVSRISRRILFVGRVVEKKGLRYLLQAMPAVLEIFPDATLVVAGDGPSLQRERRRAAELSISGNVEFLGAVTNESLPGLYASAEVFVAPFVIDSRGDQEGFGLVVAEAQACGCPVVASSLEAVHDLIEDGVTGVLVAPGDVEGIAKGVSRIFADKKFSGDIAAAARSRVVTRYDWGVVAENYRNLLCRMLGQQ